MSEAHSIKTHIQRPGAAGEIFGGLAAILVALPSAIAYGLVIYGPLGNEFAGTAAVAGIIGTIALGLLASVFGGTPGLISAPCAPAAAVLSVFAMELLNGGTIDKSLIPQVLAVAAFGGAIIQFALGALGGGKLIKFIPYPVVAGYLSGVGLTIIIGQLPKFFGYDKHLSMWAGLGDPSLWNLRGIAVGLVTILVMVFAPRLTKKVPAAILALVAGVAAYLALGLAFPGMLELKDNHMVIGVIRPPWATSRPASAGIGPASSA